jgi:hypothetical protein
MRLRPALAWLPLAALLVCGFNFCMGQSASSASPPSLPETPKPKTPIRYIPLPAASCKARDTFLIVGIKVAQGAERVGNLPDGKKPLFELESGMGLCPEIEAIHWLDRFITGPGVEPLTPAEKAHLAVHNLLDPFNFVTIAGDAGIAVASNSHSPYGPGMPGFGRYVGVSFTEDMTGEFFGTFLIPSIVHQDPHYHRMGNTTKSPIPGAPPVTTKDTVSSIARRARHAIVQVVWTQGDDGKGMVNYANIVGFAIEGEIANFYVPGQRTNLPSTAERYGTGLATAPIDNFITEFLPDVARHIHVRDVFVQRIINQVAKTGPPGS